MSTPATKISDNVVERIYITYKTRMTTEARLRRQGRGWNNLIIWYSFCAIVISLIDLTGQFKIPHANIVLAALSVGIFAVSLYVTGERYGERAEQFRSCYLALQRIYTSSASLDDKMREYAATLERFENQSDDDYDEMVFNSVLRRQKLQNAQGDISLTFAMATKVIFSKAKRIVVLGTVFLAPIAYMILAIRPN